MPPFLSRLHAYLQKSRREAEIEGEWYPHPKQYERMRKVMLPAPEILATPLQDAMTRRRSAKSFAGGTLPLVQLSTILASIGTNDTIYYRKYPSGGGLFPIETYLLAFDTESLGRSSYHYRVDNHALEELWPHEAQPDDFVQSPEGFVQDINSIAAFLVLTARWEASTPKYADFSYILALLEAGHMAQNILLSASSLGINARPFGRFESDRAIQLLHINAHNEQPAYMIGLGACA